EFPDEALTDRPDVAHHCKWRDRERLRATPVFIHDHESDEMNSLTSSPVKTRPRYHRNAYHFVFSALQFTQEKLSRTAAHVLHEEDSHINGQELCEGFRELAL